MKFEVENNEKNLVGIYSITCLANGRQYVGSTTKFCRRHKDHLRALASKTHGNRHLQFSFDKYGPESFVFKVVELVVDRIDLLSREQIHLNKLSREDFNITRTAGSVDMTEETVSKMKNAYYANEKDRLLQLKTLHDKTRGKTQSNEERLQSEISGFKAALIHRKISDRDVLAFIHLLISNPSYKASDFAKKLGVDKSTICNIFKRLSSKGNNFLPIFTPILDKIGYIKSGANSYLDIRKLVENNVLNLDVEFVPGRDNLIVDPIELHSFVKR
jgi:group I intron endonuclease